MNLKKMLLYLMLCCSVLLPDQVYSQCVDIPNPQIIFDFQNAIPDLDICGGSQEVRVVISPTTGAPYTFPCQFILDLDEPGEDHIVLNAIHPNNTPDWQIVSGQGTGHAVLQFNGTITQQSYLLRFFISASCDLLDVIATGNTQELENNQLSLSGCYNNGGVDDICIDAVSESFNLNYNLVTLQEGNSVTTVDLGEIFSMTKQMEVSGDYCVDQFSTYVTVPDNVDMTNLEVKIQMVVTFPPIGGGPGLQALFNEVIPANDICIDGNLACITVDNDLGSGTYEFCEDHFPGGMGEITMTLCSLKVTECPAGPVIWRTNSCPLPVPIGCVEPTSACYPQSETVCYVNVENGNPHLTVTANTNNLNLDFCENSSGMTYTVTNNTSDVAYGINFKVNNWQWMDLVNVSLGGLTEGGLFVSTNANSLPPGVATFFNGNSDVNFNFNNLQVANLGLFDVNCDGVYSELGPGQSITIRISMASECPFDPLLCQNEFRPNILVWRGTACWNNQCETFDESAQTSGYTNMYGDPSGVIAFCPGTLDVEDGTQFTFDYCIPEWDALPDFNEPFFDVGPMTNILQVNTAGAPGATFVCVDFNGTNFFPVQVGPNLFEVNLGQDVLPPGNGDGTQCVTLKFDFECPSIPFEGPLNIGVQLFGEWDCSADPGVPDCRAGLGCGTATFYPQCPCDETDPTCEFCSFLEATDFTAIRPTAPLNGNRCGAYVCDPITMTLTGNIAAGYNNQVGGYFTMDIFDPALPLFSDVPTVTALVNGSSVNVSVVSHDGGAPTRCYRWVTTDMPTPVTAPSTIVFTINAIADKDGIEAMPPYAYTIGNFKGGLAELGGPSGFQKCIESDISTVFNLYRVEGIYDQRPGSFANCNNGIRFNFALGYRGGTIGDEFPNEYRPINEFEGTFYVSLSGNMGGTYELVSAQANGNTESLSGTSDDFEITDLWPSFTVPDKTQFEQFTQQLSINATGDCDNPDNETVRATYTFSYRHNLFSADGSVCDEVITITEHVETLLWHNGSIVTTPSNPEITTYTGNSIDGSSEALEICFHAEDHNSDITWVQFTYPNGYLNMQFNGDEGTTCPDDGSGFTTEWFPIVGGIDQVGGCLTFDYEVLSCENEDIPLTYAIGKTCFPKTIAESVCDPDACLFEGEFNIHIEHSGMLVSIEQCNVAGPCDEITFALLIQNPGGGITTDIMLDLVLPPGMILVEAGTRHPFGVGLDLCSSTTNNDITADLSDGNALIIDQLEGAQTGTNAERRVLVHVTVRFDGCPNINQLDNALSFITTGTRNCGETITDTKDQFEDLVSNWFLDFDAELEFDEDVDLECKGDEIQGVATLNIDWTPPAATLPPGQTVTLQLFSTTNVTFTGPNPMTIPYGQSPVLVPFIFTGDPCDRGGIAGRLSTRSEFECGKELCVFSEILDTDVFFFDGSDGELTVASVEIADDVCTEETTTVTTVVTSPTQDLIGETVTATIFCDDGSGMPTGAPISSATGVLISDGMGGLTVSIVDPVLSDDILNTCNGQIVVVIDIVDGCVCIRNTGMAEACCEYCPEVGLIVECLGENTWSFTVVPDVPNLFVNYTFPGTGLPPCPTTDNPKIMTFPAGVSPTEVCAGIFSDQVSNCDDEGEGPQVIDERPLDKERISELQRLTACDTLICVPLDKCYADGSFTCEQTYNGKFWTLHVEGVYSTNMNDHTVAWMVNGSFVSGVFGPVADLIFTQPGEYEVCMVINGVFYANCEKKDLCKVKICKTIKITKDPKECWVYPAFTYQVREGEVFFTNRTTYNGDKVEYLWDFGDREQSTDANPVHRYGTEGKYKVTLTVTVYSGKEKCENRISTYIIFGRDGKGDGRDRNGGLITSDLANFQSTVYPNPARESVTFEWAAPEIQSGTVEVFNVNGQQVYYGPMKADSEGNNSLRINVENWAPGMYLLKFQGEQDSAIHRFIVE